MTHETETPFFQIKPARRQTVNCATDTPPHLSSSPYKYIIKVSTLEEIKINLLIQKDSSSSVEYCPLQNGLKIQDSVAQEPNTQAFLIQFQFSSFLKGKRSFKLQIQSASSGKTLFESSSFVLNARKKPEQDIWWKQIRTGTMKRKREENQEASSGGNSASSTEESSSSSPSMEKMMPSKMRRTHLTEPSVHAGVSDGNPSASMMSEVDAALAEM